MKKIVLLLIPALLMFSACQGGGSSINPSSGESSSELPPEPTYPTPSELLERATNDSFTVTINITCYSGGEFHDDGTYQIRKDGSKVSYLENILDNGNESFDEIFIGNKVGADQVDSYYKYNNHWLYTEDSVNEISRTYADFEDIVHMFYDIITGTECTWTYDEENHVYHGDGNEPDKIYLVDIELCIGFFSSISIISDDGDLRDEIVMTISEHNRTIINIPNTPVTTLFNKLTVLADTYYGLTNFTLESTYYSEVDGEVIDEGVATYEILTRVYPSAIGDDTVFVIKRTVGDASDFFLRHTSSTGDHQYYYADSEQGSVEEIKESYFEDVMGDIYFVASIKAQHQDYLALMISQINEMSDNHINVEFDYSLLITGFYPTCVIDFNNDNLITSYNLSFDGNIVLDSRLCPATFLNTYLTSNVGTTNFTFPDIA